MKSFNGSNLQHVTCLHGNETLPRDVLLAKGIEQIIGNPEAVRKKVRFIDKDLNSAFKKVHLGILKIIDKSSKRLLLLDKNFIAVFGELSNILKNISGIFSGCFLSTFKNILSNN